MYKFVSANEREREERRGTGPGRTLGAVNGRGMDEQDKATRRKRPGHHLQGLSTWSTWLGPVVDARSRSRSRSRSKKQKQKQKAVLTGPRGPWVLRRGGRALQGGGYGGRYGGILSWHDLLRGRLMGAWWAPGGPTRAGLVAGITRPGRGALPSTACTCVHTVGAHTYIMYGSSRGQKGVDGKYRFGHG